MVPAGEVAAYSDGMKCPGCQSRLEVSFPSRFIATTVGLLAAALVWRLTRSSAGMLGWVLPVVYAFLGFSAVAPVVLMLTADLVLKSEEPVAEPVSAGSANGHVGAHH